MKQITIILILLILTAPLARASESLSGRVVDLDLPKGLMVVEPFRPGHHMKHRGRGWGWGRSSGRGHGMGSMEIVVSLPAGPLPDFVKEGSVIRIRGNFLEGSTKIFQAEEFQTFEGDPTGVRERLKKQCDRPCDGKGWMGHGKMWRGKMCGE